MPRAQKLYRPGQEKLFPLSRSKVDLLRQCPRCFYLDRRLGIARPPGYPFSLNSAVDAHLKKELDVQRWNEAPHPLMDEAGIDAVPFAHPELEIWMSNFKGIRIDYTGRGDGHHRVIEFDLASQADPIETDTICVELTGGVDRMMRE